MDVEAYDLEPLSYDAAKLQAKLHAFDSWLWSDCEGGQQFQPTFSLQFDCVEAMKGSLEPDPPLFRGNQCSLEPNSHSISAHLSADANDSMVPTLAFENARNFAYGRHGSGEPRLKPRPLCRESPDELDSDQIHQEKAMQNRANKMKDMLDKQIETQSQWAKDSDKVHAWLVNNHFFTVNFRRSSFLSFTYPLHVAAAQNDEEILQLLVAREADPHQLDSKSRSALQVAARKCKHGSHRKAVAALTAAS